MKKDVVTLVSIYSTKLYTALISIALVPVAIKLLGIESYGLIGIFTILQSCLGILEAGIGSVLTRQAIIAKNDLKSYLDFEILYKKSLMFFFAVVSIIWVISIFIFNQRNNVWIKTSLDVKLVNHILAIMLWVISLKYLQSPYRSILLAAEKQKTLSLINTLSVTISQPLAIYFVLIFQSTALMFFYFQLIAAFVTTLITMFYAHKSMAAMKVNIKNSPDRTQRKMTFKGLIAFSFQLSLLSILWIVVNQSDKLALSHYMELKDYAHYGVALTIAALISVLNEPLNQFLQPRLTRYHSEFKYDEFGRVFINAFIIMTMVLIPVSIMLFFFSDTIIMLWSSDINLAKYTSVYLPWIFFGGVFGVYSNLIFLLLYSFGKLKTHTIVYTLFALLVIPINIIIAKCYLGYGSSMLFLATSSILFLSWGGFNLYKHFHNGSRVITLIISPVILISYLSFYALREIDYVEDSKIMTLLLLFGSWLFVESIIVLYIFCVRRSLFQITLKKTV